MHPVANGPVYPTDQIPEDRGGGKGGDRVDDFCHGFIHIKLGDHLFYYRLDDPVVTHRGEGKAGTHPKGVPQIRPENLGVDDDGILYNLGSGHEIGDLPPYTIGV